MYHHAPQDYTCPICLSVQGVENEQTLIRQSDIVLQTDLVTAFISSFFIGNNQGHVVIVPNKHFENIYDIPTNYAHAIFDASQKVSLALKKAYRCEGTTILQNNEPAGNQHAFHYHMHVFPRYSHDNLHENMMDKKLVTPEERLSYAQKIKEALK